MSQDVSITSFSIRQFYLTQGPIELLLSDVDILARRGQFYHSRA